MKSKRFYFDYAASTPMDPMVKKVMEPYWSEKFGNPGSLHWFGQEASAAVFASRRTIASALGCDYKEVIFTGSATEANNLALRGVLKGHRSQVIGNFKSTTYDLRPKIIVSAIEHESILDTARKMEMDPVRSRSPQGDRSHSPEARAASNGVDGEVDVAILPVLKNGIVDLKKLKNLLDERTILVSVMYANNEVGTIQPIAEISKIISDFKNSKLETRNTKQIQNSKNKNFSDFGFRISDFEKRYPLFHTDAVQAFNYLPCSVDELGVDLMTLSAQKIYGPKGIGLLYIRNSKLETRNSKQIQNSKNKNFSDFGFRILDFPMVQPLVIGGGQEFGLRSGTENVPAIVGFGKAVELSGEMRKKESARLEKLRDYFWKNIQKKIPKAELNGDAKNRLPNNINMYLPGIKAEDLITKLDLAGFAVSSGSACSARAAQPSHVLKAMGYSEERAKNSIRITFGRPTTQVDVDKLLKVIYNSP